MLNFRHVRAVNFGHCPSSLTFSILLCSLLTAFLDSCHLWGPSDVVASADGSHPIRLTAHSNCYITTDTKHCCVTLVGTCPESLKYSN